MPNNTNSLALIYSAVLLTISTAAIAQAPESCIQSSKRDAICDHLIYKRSPVSIEPLGIEQGQMVCLCMADYQSLRIPITEGLAATHQLVELKRAARDLGVDEHALIQLIRD